MTTISEKHVAAATAASKDRFERDDKLKGFALKIAPSGTKSFVVEARVKGGKTRRITLGRPPAMSVAQARQKASQLLASMQMGVDPVEEHKRSKALSHGLSKSLKDVFREYLEVRTLREKTAKDYTNTYNAYFSSWHKTPIREVTRRMVQDRFVEVRDNHGLPTARKAFAILSALFNFAKADEVLGQRLVTDNPVNVLKEKGFDQKIKARERYLSEDEIARIITFYQTEKDWPETPKHGVTDQGINFVMLLLCSGLRRSEGLKLRWEDVYWENEFFVVHDTKNGTDHYVPLSRALSQTLTNQREYLARIDRSSSPWVFPARHGDGHMTEPKSQLKKICEATGLNFHFHDLRRTFATHAEANGAQYSLIQRALNHKSKTVTQGYLITQIDTLRPVFDAVADGYHSYYNPNWRNEEAAEESLELAILKGELDPSEATEIEFQDLSSG